MEILSLPENEPFITGIEESIDICSNQIIKHLFFIAVAEKPT